MVHCFSQNVSFSELYFFLLFRQLGQLYNVRYVRTVVHINYTIVCKLVSKEVPLKKFL